MNYSRSQSPNPRIMDKLEQQYNGEAHQHWVEGKRKQNLYYKIAQMEQASMNERKSMQKQLKEKQDNKVKLYWKAEEERFRQMQRRKKEEVNNVRKVNNNLSLEIMQQSKQKEQFVPFNNYNDFCYQQLLKQKRQKEQLYRQGQQYKEIKNEQQKFKKLMDVQVDHLKVNEREQIERKRQAQFKRIRDKHQQNYNAYYYLDEKIRQRQADQDKLENYIVNKGQNDQQARLLELRAQFEAKEKQRKQNHIRQLKGQLEEDTHRHIYDRKNQIENQKQLIDQRNRYYSQMDKLNRMRKSQEDKKMLEVLKSQVKPRKLLPDPDVPEKIGLGSPVNIGKVMGDDRKRQLDWIQKSLLRQIHY